jgi:DNA repair exonuclease SbcCD ATPase subunit
MADPRRSLAPKPSETMLSNAEPLPRLSRKNCEDCRAHDEYIKVLRSALQEVLDQNEALRARVAELEALITQSEDDLDEKTALLSQLRKTLKELQDSRTACTDPSEAEKQPADPSN